MARRFPGELPCPTHVDGHLMPDSWWLIRDGHEWFVLDFKSRLSWRLVGELS